MTDAPPTRVLIVEDDPVVVETLTTYLEHAGFDVIATGDGADGLTRAQSPDVAMVILDWMVPGMSGPEVCRRLRAVSSVPVADAHGAHRRGRPGARPRNRRRRLRAQAVQPARGRRARAGAASARPAAAGGRTTRPPTSVGELQVDHFKREVRVAGARVAADTHRVPSAEALVRIRDARSPVRNWSPVRSGPTTTASTAPSTHTSPTFARKLNAGRRPLADSTVHGVGYRLVVPE